MPPITNDWQQPLEVEFKKPYYKDLYKKVLEEYRSRQIFPNPDDIFYAFHLTPLNDVKVVILGQDPYHNDGQAHGLAFSVRPGVTFPPSLRNIFKELNADLGTPVPESGSLDEWAKQGVLLLNTVLTVRAHAAGSHQKHGWEEFTDSVIRAVSAFPRPVVFVLWGGPAQKKLPLIDTARHTVIQSAHPSPLSAYRGFFGSRPFSAINAFLREQGAKEICWDTQCRTEEYREVPLF